MRLLWEPFAADVVSPNREDVDVQPRAAAPWSLFKDVSMEIIAFAVEGPFVPVHERTVPPPSS